MANSEFLEILSPGALEELKQVQVLVKSLATDIKSINDFKTASTPSGADKNIKSISDSYDKQAKSIEKVKSALEKTTAVQERENQSIKSKIPTLNQLTKAQKSLSDAYTILVNKQKQARNELRSLTVEQGKNSLETRKAQRAYDDLTKKVNQANMATSNFSKTGLGKMVAGFKNLLGAFGVVGGIYLFANLAKTGFDLTRKLDSLNFTMKAVIENAEVLKRTQLFLTSTAEQYGASIVTLTERYNKFYTAARQSGVTLDDTEQIFKSFTKSAGFLGLKTHELEGVFLALEQMLSKGKVTTEELRRQLGERLPGAFGVMAQTVQKLNPDIKVTVATLDKMLRAGSILSAEVLPEFAKQYEKSIGVDQKNRVETLNASIERMTNSWVSFVGAVSTGDGILSKVLLNIVDLIGDVVKGMDYMAMGSNKIIDTRNYEIFNDVLQSQSKMYKELGDEANSYAKINKKNSEAELERLRKDKLRQEAIMAVQSEKLGILKYANKAYTDASQKSEKLSYAISREKAELEAANRQLNGYVESQVNASDKGRTLADVLKDLADAQAELKNSTADEAPAILDRIDALNKEKDAWERTNSAKEKKLKAIKDISKGTNSYANEVSSLIGILEKAQSLEVKGSQNYNDLQKTIDNLTIALYPFKEANKKANDEIKNGIDAQKREEEQLKTLKNALDDFRSGFADTFFSDTGFDFTGNFLTHFDEMTAAIEAGGNKWEDYFNVITEMGQEAYNFIANASQQNFDAEYARLEKQKDIAIQFAGESDAAKQKIEQQYEARKKAIQAREARAQKEMAIVNTVINTAQAIMQIWAHSPDPTGISQGTLTAIIAGIGAAQVAIIASQKIPEFWKGTDNADEGLAWTQEKGQEIITDKKGIVKDYGDGKGARLTMMEKGDKVYTADQTRKMMFNNELNGILSNNGISKSEHQINVVNNGLTRTDLDQVMSKHFSNIQTNQTVIDKNGLNTYVKKQNSKTRLLNNRVSFKGFSV